MKNLLKNYIIAVILIILALDMMAQKTIDGIAYHAEKSTKLDNVEIAVMDALTKRVIANAITNEEGKYRIEGLEVDKVILIAEKDKYFFREKEVVLESEKNKFDFRLERKPGYTFDVNLINSDFIKGKVDLQTVSGTRVEVYNNTKEKEELVILEHKAPSFKFNFEEGNHYTIMIRKKGFLTRRVEAYVDVEGCILCFDGIGEVRPGVVDVLANENQLGAFLADLEMDPIELNKTFDIENLYYDFDESYIRPDAEKVLDGVLTILSDNPNIEVEMGSHTDARGNDAYNMDLSDRRAESAVNYLVGKGISRSQLTWKGYGESKLANHCGNGVECSEELHQKNRRTQLRITGIKNENPLDKKSLKEIIEEGKFYAQRSTNSY